MNLKYLGDALDHWKGSLIARLDKEHLLRSIAVDRMATDTKTWRSDDLVLYADLVGLSRDQILSHTTNLNKDRLRYFQEIVHDGDILLDPDTGIATSEVKRCERAKYLYPCELVGLCERKPNSIVAVYQHVSRQKTQSRIDKVISSVNEREIRLACCSYESASVAMLFFSKEQDRVQAICTYFKKWLGRHARGRVRDW